MGGVCERSPGARGWVCASGQRAWKEVVQLEAVAATAGNLRGEMVSGSGLVLQLLPPGAFAADLAWEQGNAEKKAFCSSLLCYFWILHHV